MTTSEQREQIAATLNLHHPTTGMAVASGTTCACGYWTGSEPEAGKRPLPWGRDRLDLHRADVVAEMIAAAVQEAKAETLMLASKAMDDSLRHFWDDAFWKLDDRKYNSPSDWLDAYAATLATEAVK